MIHNSYLFDFQEILSDIREKAKDDEEKKDLALMLDTISDDTELEDLPLYKEYLSLFDVEHDLGDIELHYPSEMEDCKSDFMTLLRFVSASFSSSYNLEYDEDSNSVDLLITVRSGDHKITKKLHKLWTYQIAHLFNIYLEEMLKLEALRLTSEDDKNTIDEERKMKVVIYQKKIKQLKSKKDCGDVKNIDDLLDV